MKIALVDQIYVIAKGSLSSLYILFIFKKSLKALLYTINEQAKSLSRFPACLTTGGAGEYPELFCTETEAETDHYKHRRPTKKARTVLYRAVAELASGVERTVTCR